MTKKALLVGVVLILVVGAQPASVLACSGYPYFGIDDLPSMELLVRATVLEADDRGYNAIIRVDDYYKGDGAQYLAVMRYSPGLASGAAVRGYDTGCLYAGRGHRWLAGDQGYFGLQSNGDGTFTDENGGTAHFYAVDGIIQYEEGATEGYAAEFDDPLKITEAEFIELMLKVGGRKEPVQPDSEAPQHYPLHRFLNFTTEKGTRYQVNPDLSVRQLPDNAAIAISPDGAHAAFLIDSETITFRYIVTEYSGAENAQITEVLQALDVPGQAVRFANDSNFAAVWNRERLTVVMLSNDGETYYSGYGTGMRARQIAQVELRPLGDRSLPVVHWSGDSSTLVWQDGDGLWIWNLYDSAEATRLKIAGSEPVLDISRHGRYVRYGSSEGWTLLEVASGRTFPNTLISPSEQFLIQPSTTASTSESDREAECRPPLRTNCTVTMASGSILPVAVFPYRMHILGMMYCPTEDEGCLVGGQSWHPAIYANARYGDPWYFLSTMSGVRQVVYDGQYDLAAALVGDYGLYFDFYPDSWVANPEYQPYLNILELEDTIDAPIAEIEWGQPIFYDEYRLTTTDYMGP